MEGQSSDSKKPLKNNPAKSGSDVKDQSLFKRIIKAPFIIFANKLNKKSKESLLTSIFKVIDNSEAQGLIAGEEKRMIKNIINIGGVKAGDVMVKRTDIVAIKEDADLTLIKRLIVTEEHTRMPVFRDNLDDIIGFIHSKDLLKFLGSNPDTFTINKIIRKILYVPNSMGIIDLLLKMRSSRVHIAIVLDEYGGTDGLVTIEDIVEEIVGEIEDEHDFPDNNIYTLVKKISDNILHVGGRVEIKKIEDLLKVVMNDGHTENGFETVGGLILSELKKVPEIGETVRHECGLTFKVLDADMRSVKLVEIVKEESSL